MPAIPNPCIRFLKTLASGYPVDGEHLVLDNSRTLDIHNVPLNGGFLTKTLLLSPEPAIRERMRDPSILSYTTTIPVGAPMIGPGLVQVVRSEKDGVTAGDYMYGQTPWEAYTVQPYIESRAKYSRDAFPEYTFDMDALVLQKVQNPGSAFPWASYCNTLGTPGMTGYFGFEGLADAKEGDTIFVSSGASGVGTMVVQLAKTKGLKVITSAGTDEKVAFLKSLGADVAFNYKTTPYATALKEHGPIQVYWDNVGGEALEAAIEAADFKARFVMCGSSGDYNVPDDERYGVKNTTLIFKKRLIIRGLLIPDLAPQFAGKFFTEVPALLAQGKINGPVKVTEGLENAVRVFIDLLKGGADLGKPVIEVVKF